MNPKLGDLRPAKGEGRDTQNQQSRLSAAPVGVNSFDFLEFMRAPDFDNFLRSFPTISPERPAPSEQRKTQTKLKAKHKP